MLNGKQFVFDAADILFEQGDAFSEGQDGALRLGECGFELPQAGDCGAAVHTAEVRSASAGCARGK